LKIQLTYNYQTESFHEKKYDKQVEDIITADLKEVEKKDAPIVIRVVNTITERPDNELVGVRKIEEYLLYEGNFYKEAYGICTIHGFICTITHYFFFKNYSQDEIRQGIRNYVNRHILLDGIIYEKVCDPKYVVFVYGKGKGQGGTSLVIKDYYDYEYNNGKIKYFNALKREKAIAFAKAIAEKREDICDFDSCLINIEVLNPEIVLSNPDIEFSIKNFELDKILEQ